MIIVNPQIFCYYIFTFLINYSIFIIDLKQNYNFNIQCHNNLKCIHTFNLIISDMIISNSLSMNFTIHLCNFYNCNDNFNIYFQNPNTFHIYMKYNCINFNMCNIINYTLNKYHILNQNNLKYMGMNFKSKKDLIENYFECDMKYKNIRINLYMFNNYDGKLNNLIIRDQYILINMDINFIYH